MEALSLARAYRIVIRLLKIRIRSSRATAVEVYFRDRSTAEHFCSKTFQGAARLAIWPGVKSRSIPGFEIHCALVSQNEN